MSGKNADFLVFKTFAAIGAISVKGGNVYQIFCSVIDAGDYDENAVINLAFESMRLNSNGLLIGIYDGFMTPLHAIGMIVSKNYHVYSTANNGVIYLIGFILGIIILLLLLISKLGNS